MGWPRRRGSSPRCRAGWRRPSTRAGRTSPAANVNGSLVKRPQILVFDDSFSALDFKTDSLLRAALREDIVDATVIIVAQRVGTIMHADQIVVLDAGEIAGVGTHAELMERCETYREIVFSQLSAEEAA